MPNYRSPGVYIDELQAASRPIEGVGTAIAAFVGLTAKGDYNKPTLVSNWSQFTQAFGEFVDGSYLAHSVYGYFLNGGGAAYIVRVGGDGAGTSARSELTAGRQGMLGQMRVVVRDPAAEGQISVEVADPGEGATEDQFRLIVKRNGEVVDDFDKVTMKKGKQNVATVVNEKSKLIKIEETSTAGALEKPPKGAIALVETSAVPARLTPTDFIGSAAERTGLGHLETEDLVTMVCVPDLMAAYRRELIDLEQVQTVQQAILDHCTGMGDRMAILDSPPGHNYQQIREWRVDKVKYASNFATLYWPWVKVFDPLSKQNVLVPPSGHMAGIWGRNDDTRGVHKAPANEVVRGAIDVEFQVTRKEQEELNPVGINCIRSFPGRGIRIWGARTLADDASWRYINVRRLFNYLEESILNGTQWAVFEPNDDALWARMRRTISAFLVNEWRKGALFGITPDEAFYVKCDAETNTAESIDAGMVICEIGVAPVKPAEFVIFRIAQYSGGASLTE